MFVNASTKGQIFLERGKRNKKKLIALLLEIIFQPITKNLIVVFYLIVQENTSKIRIGFVFSTICFVDMKRDMNNKYLLQNNLMYK